MESIRRILSSPSSVVMIAAAVVAIAVWGFWPPAADEFEEEFSVKAGVIQAADLAPQVDFRGEYAGSDSCRTCHSEQHESWHASYHRAMTQVATPESVIGDFDDVRLRSRDRSYHLQRQGDQFWVTMPDPDIEDKLQGAGYDLGEISEHEIPMARRRVVMTTGSHHYQGYWVKSTTIGNHFQTFPWFYLIEEQRWIPREDVFLAQPGTFRHFKTWNDSCIQCHSTGGFPGFDAKTYSFKTTVAELGIACEACHGPGAVHVAHQEVMAANSTRPAPGPDSTIVNPARLPHEASVEVCGQCHSHFKQDFELFLENGRQFRPGMQMEESFYSRFHDGIREGTNETTSSEVYWQDRACRIGGREYLGLLESQCYQQGTMSCLSCHSMHESDPNDQLAERMDGNDACLQCHASIGKDLQRHTHHLPESSGSLCYNCHMPHTAFALLKAIRSHRVDSPDVQSTARTGRPGACNLCHLDKTLQWTSEHMSQWYGHDSAELSQPQRETAASLLWMLSGDAVQRSVVAWHMGWPEAAEASGTNWQAPFLAHLLDDDYSVVRFVAGRSLRSLPGSSDLKYDFLAEPEARSRVRQQIVDQWTAAEGGTPERFEDALLIDRSGQLRGEEIRRLLQQGRERPELYHPE